MVGVADLVVVTGPPGAGKTTVARLLSSMFEPSALVAGDDVFAFIQQGYLAPWTAQADQQNKTIVGAAAAAAGRLTAGGYTVIYDGVIGPWFLEAFGQAATLDCVHYALLLPPEEDCIRRVRSRVRHGFTDVAAVRHMYRDFSDADVDPRHLVPATGGPADIASSICESMRAGLLRVETRV